MKPSHGTYSRYSKHGCRCFACRVADHNYRAAWYAEVAEGRPRIVDAAPAREHFQRWREATGAGQRVFARLAGVSQRAVFAVVTEQQAKIKRTTLEAFLSVPITDASPPDRDEVPSIGYRRRVEALAAIGYGVREQSRRLGLNESNLRASVMRQNIHATTAERIERLYAELCAHPVSGTHSADQARRHALKQGWVGPLAWDDIDDPNEQPQGRYQAHRRRDEIDEAVVLRILAGEHVDCTRAERDEAMRRWRDAGKSERELCLRMNWKPGRYGKEDAA